MFTGCHRLKCMPDTSRYTSFRSACQYIQAGRHFHNCLPDSILYTRHHVSFVVSNTAHTALICSLYELRDHYFLTVQNIEYIFNAVVVT